MITNVRPLPLQDPADYEVVWNGAHENRDGDLLTEIRVPVKIQASPPEVLLTYHRHILATSQCADRRARAQAALAKLTR